MVGRLPSRPAVGNAPRAELLTFFSITRDFSFKGSLSRVASGRWGVGECHANVECRVASFDCSGGFETAEVSSRGSVVTPASASLIPASTARTLQLEIRKAPHSVLCSSSCPGVSGRWSRNRGHGAHIQRRRPNETAICGRLGCRRGPESAALVVTPLCCEGSAVAVEVWFLAAVN